MLFPKLLTKFNNGSIKMARSFIFRWIRNFKVLFLDEIEILFLFLDELEILKFYF